MYDYDRSKTAAGPLKVTKTGPVEFEYAHSTHGPVRVVWGDKGWYAETKDHKLHALGFGGITPSSSNHPNAQKILAEQVEKVLAKT